MVIEVKLTSILKTVVILQSDGIDCQEGEMLDYQAKY